MRLRNEFIPNQYFELPPNFRSGLLPPAASSPFDVFSVTPNRPGPVVKGKNPANLAPLTACDAARHTPHTANISVALTLASFLCLRAVALVYRRPLIFPNGSINMLSNSTSTARGTALVFLLLINACFLARNILVDAGRWALRSMGRYRPDERLALRSA